MASSRRAVALSRMTDEQLLETRFCDLGLSLARAPRVQRAVRRLHRELDQRGIAFKPHAWLGEEWFSPDGVPGIAIPFYLAHPRLARLERRLMKQVEGGSSRWLMRILRHEAGHALDTAYRLRRRRRWREAFGPASIPYPRRYRARPGSRRYVHHLGDWYAQAHPTEDFAETFAVWLKPNSDWRQSYAGWPALRKLHLVDELMQEARTRAPAVRARSRIEPVEESTRTLAEHYRDRLAAQLPRRRGSADDLLCKVFTDEPARRTSPRASALLRSNRKRLASQLSRDTGVARYSVLQIMRIAIERTQELGLHVRGSRRESLRAARRALAKIIRLYTRGEARQFAL